jgi:hypothetical protein
MKGHKSPAGDELSKRIRELALYPGPPEGLMKNFSVSENIFGTILSNVCTLRVIGQHPRHVFFPNSVVVPDLDGLYSEADQRPRLD